MDCGSLLPLSRSQPAGEGSSPQAADPERQQAAAVQNPVVTPSPHPSYIAALQSIHTRERELECKNQLLRAKYANDAKYARLHKRLMGGANPRPTKSNSSKP